MDLKLPDGITIETTILRADFTRYDPEPSGIIKRLVTADGETLLEAEYADDTPALHSSNPYCT